MIIYAHCMRHGQKNPDHLNDLAKHTPEGAEQVRQSARNNLIGVKFDALFRSNLYRTLELVTYVTGELPEQDGGLDVISVSEFGYLENPYLDQYYTAGERIKKQDKPANVADWLREAPEMTEWSKYYFHHALWQKAFDAYKKAPIKDRQNVKNWLIGSHSPHCELLALDPSNTPALREADIICYTLDVSSKMVEQHGEEVPCISMTITESKYTPRGF